jgi:membrane protease YdiL (CAAX protease family)
MFASHKLPGFANPAVFTNVLISANAQPFSLSLNFDKGSAGLILLANFAPRITSVNQVKSLLLATVTAVAVISVIVFPIAGLIGYVTFDPKVPDHYMIFLANNLIFTCVAEEAFCRGVIQQGIAQTRPLACTSDPSEPLPDEVNKPSCRAVLGIAVSTTVFAFGHAKGGPLAVGFAALAGLGYAVVFARTQRIEASILTHLSINAIHFFCFTYPSLMR